MYYTFSIVHYFSILVLPYYIVTVLQFPIPCSAVFSAWHNGQFPSWPHGKDPALPVADIWSCQQYCTQEWQERIFNKTQHSPRKNANFGALGDLETCLFSVFTSAYIIQCVHRVLYYIIG